MNISLFTSFLYSTHILLLVCTFLSFRFKKRFPFESEINGFRYYFVVAIISNVLDELLSGLALRIFFYLFYFFELFFITSFFVRILPKKVNRHLYVIALILCLYGVLSMLEIVSLGEPSGFFTLENCFFVYLSLKYYRSISTFEPAKSISQDPTFWVVNGLFFLFSIQTPLRAAVWYFIEFNLEYALNYGNNNKEVARFFGSIPGFAFLICLVFFIVAYTRNLSAHLHQTNAK